MGRRDFFEEEKRKKMVMTFMAVVGLAMVAFVTVFVMYSKKLNDEAQANLLALADKDENLVSNEELEETSFSSDKTVQNVNYANNSVQVPIEAETENENVVEKPVKSPESKEPVSPVVEEETSKPEEPKVEQPEAPQTVEEELSFQAPVVGEIMKDYAMDTLVYSKTLDEWCTHSGIDIKADKTAVVQAAEKGKVESIKNDPRYGLTVIISHGGGFKTMYSNLLTTEFVKEGEEVEKGQTIATVGETASFEVADECHLHFEMYKDGISVNPTIYFK